MPRRFKTAFLSTSALAWAIALTTGAQAQQQSSPPTPERDQTQQHAQDQGTQGTTVSGVVVTGSRIAQPNLQQPTPVAEVTPTLIQNSGTAQLGDIISQLPELGVTGTLRANSNNYGGGAGPGISTANLRNLGSSRTLVLVDGYRHVAGDIFTDAVDLNSIPTALVDHVEVITGGASAIYGSDAVSGVVNIILKKSFDGVDVQGQAGGYDGGFGGRYSFQGTVGHSFLNDRLHMDLTFSFDREDAVNMDSIRNAKNYGTVVNPADATCAPDFSYCSNPKVNDGIPDRLWVQNVGSKFVTANGVLLNAFTFQPQYSFNSFGQLIPVPTQTGYNSFAFGQLSRDCLDCYFASDYTQLASPFTSKGAEFRTSYDFTPHLRAFLDAKYVETNTVNTIQPSYTFGDYQLQPDNAFISPALAAALAGTPADEYPYISKFLNDFRNEDVYRRTYRVVAGFRGDVDVGFTDIGFDAAVNYGRTDAHFSNYDLRITNNFQAAFDSVINPATGQPACRINVPSAPQTGLGAGAAAGCIPFDPFGVNQLAGAMAYSFGQFDTRDSLSQQDATINLRADTSRFFNFPGGPLSVAAGAEYRMERTFEVNDPRLVAGDTEDLASNSAGGFNVYEGYIEGVAPFFRHNGFLLDDLSLDVAYRGAEYSFKQVRYADAYKVGGVYGPFSWIKFRGTYSQAIRAPNITEAFSPVSSTYFNIADPCSAENITTNVNYSKNCAAQGIPAGFIANTNSSIIGQSSGNPNLQPEQSLSYTGGFILQPSFLRGFSLSMDFYSIKIKDAITQVAAQDILNNCYSGTSLSTQYCSLFTRDPTSHNINFVQTTYVNASKLETEGVDLEANYSTSVAPLTSRWSWTQWATGRFAMNLTLNYTYKFRNYPFQNDPTQIHILEGTTNYPQWRGLISAQYTQGSWQVDYTGRYFGRVATFNRDPTQADFSEATNEPYASPRFYHDLALHYYFSGTQTRGLELFAGVRNIFGELPPAILIGNGYDYGYDFGRYYFAGVRFRM